MSGQMRQVEFERSALLSVGHVVWWVAMYLTAARAGLIAFVSVFLFFPLRGLVEARFGFAATQRFYLVLAIAPAPSTKAGAPVRGGN